MDKKTLGKNVSAYLKMPELERLKRLQDNGFSIAAILRRGIEAVEKKSIDNLTQNNIS